MTSRASALKALLGPQSLLTLGVLGIVGALFIPVSPGVLDFLVTLSLSGGVLVLLMVLRLRTAMEFSTFPSLLLLATFFRLSTNVASTRLILTTGEGGSVISGFGQYVVGGSLVVGLVVFLILNVINFVVITKGAGRIAEVAARFALDALPGKQMAIDQEMASNAIDEAEASRRRDELVRETNFAGVMDGAMKFVRGDAIAGLVITSINLLGGFAIGILVQGLSASESIAKYVLLSVGDGLVTQIPSVLISLAAALLSTYGNKGPGFSVGVLEEMGATPSTLQVAGGAVAALGLAPGLPLLPFALFGGTLGVTGWRLARHKPEIKVAAPVSKDDGAAAGALGAAPPPGEVDLDLGMQLIGSIEDGLLPRLRGLRGKLSNELGFPLPPARIRDNMELPGNAYRLWVREEGQPIGHAVPQHLLVFSETGGTVRLGDIESIPTTDPVLRRPAAWIREEYRVDVEALGYRTHDVSTVIATHVADVLRKQAWRLLTRQQVKELVTSLQERAPALVDDLVPNKVSYGVLHRVLQGLLREGVSIRQIDVILEAIGDAPADMRDIDALVEMARRQMGGVIAQRYVDKDGVLRPIVLSPEAEVALMGLTGTLGSQHSPSTRLDKDAFAALVQSAAALATKHRRGSEPRPFLVSPTLRGMLRRVLEQGVPHVAVLATSEIPAAVHIDPIAKVELIRA